MSETNAQLSGSMLCDQNKARSEFSDGPLDSFDTLEGEGHLNVPRAR
jgi:hypothetical protein